MKKIATLFEKDPYDLSKVIDYIPSKNLWVLTDGIATRKYDGTACAIIDNELYKRYDVKKGRSIPEGAIPCQEADHITGHHPHWIKVVTSDKYHLEGLANSKHLDLSDGTYELVGPKVQSNPDKFNQHMLVPHGQYVLTDFNDFSFDGVREYLSTHPYEGIVFHHKNTLTDGRMCKIRRKDFGLPWPI